MSKIKNSIIYFALLMLTITSCGSLKSGKLKYHKKNNTFTAQENSTHQNYIEVEDAKTTKSFPINTSIQNANIENNPSELTIPKTELTTKDTLTKKNCDILIMNDGKEISVKIIEIGIDQIKYKRCEFLEGPTYSINASNAKSITYSNGAKEVIAKKTTPPSKPRAHIAGLVLGLVGLSLGLALAIISSQMLLLIAAGLGLIAIIIAINSFVALKKQPDAQIGRTLGAISVIFGGLSLVALTITFLLAIIL